LSAIFYSISKKVLFNCEYLLISFVNVKLIKFHVFYFCNGELQVL